MSKTVPFQTIQLTQARSLNITMVYLSKTFLFQAIPFIQTLLIQTIQFNINTQFYLTHP